MKEYRVTLAAEEREQLGGLLSRGKADVRKLKRACDPVEGGRGGGQAGLAVYCRPDDPKRPVVCRDETSKQLNGESREPHAAAAAIGRAQRCPHQAAPPLPIT